MRVTFSLGRGLQLCQALQALLLDRQKDWCKDRYCDNFLVQEFDVVGFALLKNRINHWCLGGLGNPSYSRKALRMLAAIKVLPHRSATSRAFIKRNLRSSSTAEKLRNAIVQAMNPESECVASHISSDTSAGKSSGSFTNRRSPLALHSHQREGCPSLSKRRGHRYRHPECREFVLVHRV